MPFQIKLEPYSGSQEISINNGTISKKKIKRWKINFYRKLGKLQSPNYRYLVFIDFSMICYTTKYLFNVPTEFMYLHSIIRSINPQSLSL